MKIRYNYVVIIYVVIMLFQGYQKETPEMAFEGFKTNSAVFVLLLQILTPMGQRRC